MAEWLEQVSQWHEMYYHDLAVTSSNPGRVEFGVCSTSVLSRTLTKNIKETTLQEKRKTNRNKKWADKPRMACSQEDNNNNKKELHTIYWICYCSTVSGLHQGHIYIFPIRLVYWVWNTADIKETYQLCDPLKETKERKNVFGSSTIWDRSTMHPKFDVTGVWTHNYNLQIMTVHFMSLRRLL